MMCLKMILKLFLLWVMLIPAFAQQSDDTEQCSTCHQGKSNLKDLCATELEEKLRRILDGEMPHPTELPADWKSQIEKKAKQIQEPK